MINLKLINASLITQIGLFVRISWRKNTLFSVTYLLFITKVETNMSQSSRKGIDYLV